MKYLESKLVALLTLSTGLCTIYGFRSTNYREETRTGDHKWTKSFQNVYSEIACGVICAGDTELCKTWQHIPEQNICLISTDKATVQSTGTNPVGKVWSIEETSTPAKEYCRVPFVNVSQNEETRIANDSVSITNQCDPEFCFIETRHADDCRRTGNWTSACGSCKRIEWRNKTVNSATMFTAPLPSPIREGWRVTLTATPLNNTAMHVLNFVKNRDAVSLMMEVVTDNNQTKMNINNIGPNCHLEQRTIDVPIYMGNQFEIMVLVNQTTFDVSVDQNVVKRVLMEESLVNLAQLITGFVVRNFHIENLKFFY